MKKSAKNFVFLLLMMAAVLITFILAKSPNSSINFREIKLIEVSEYAKLDETSSPLKIENKKDIETIKRIFLTDAVRSTDVDEELKSYGKAEYHFRMIWTDHSELNFDFWFDPSQNESYYSYKASISGINLFKISQEDTIILKRVME